MGKIIVISDLHLGSNAAQEDAILQFLHESWIEEIDFLVVNGDLLDSPGSISAIGWEILGTLRYLRNLGVRVAVTPGNHDPNAVFVAHVAGLAYMRNIQVNSGGKRFWILHGHVGPYGEEWDKSLHSYPLPTRLANILEDHIAFFGSWGRRLAVAMHHTRKWLFDCRLQVRNAALQVVGTDVVICGHTHMPEDIWVNGKQAYVNGGSWAEERCTYVEIENGTAKLMEYKDGRSVSLSNCGRP